MRSTLFKLSLCSLLSIAAPQLHAKIIEEVVDVVVTVKDMYGKEITQPIKVTIFRDDRRARSPFMLIGHGRPSSSADFAKMGRVRFHDNAAYFLAKGFAVFVPTRVGYGVSGGEDVEYTGTCGARVYPAGFEAAAQQMLAVIDLARSLPTIDPARGVILGQSFGGGTAIAVAAKAPPGIVAAINFSGGSGGNPTVRPGEPCRPDLMKKTFADYGATSRMPTLWLYSENDQYFGKEHPRSWFEAFTAQGAAGEFVQMPALPAALGTDGHQTFAKNPEVWHDVVNGFLERNGF